MFTSSSTAKDSSEDWAVRSERGVDDHPPKFHWVEVPSKIA